MRIVYYNRWLYVKDGCGVQSQELIKALNEIPDVELEVFPPISHQRREEKVNRLKKIFFNTELRTLLPLVRRIWWFFTGTPQEKFDKEADDFKRYVEACSPDVILAHLGFVSLIQISQILQWKYPLVAQVDAPIFYEVEFMSGRKQKESLKKLEIEIWRKADAIVTISSGLAEMIIEEKVNPEKIFIAPNGVNPELFNPDVDVSWVYQKLKLVPSDSTIIGYVGTFSKIHDLHTLIKAFKKVLDEYRNSNLKLLLVGDGPDYPELLNRVREYGIEENVIFVTGFVRHEEIPSYIKIMDIAVAPFPVENLKYSSPIKLFEYMAMAKPIVATEGGQVKEIIENGKDGILVKAGDYWEMAQGIIKLLNDRHIAQEMGRKARKKVLENYTWRHHARKVLEACKFAISHRARAI